MESADRADITNAIWLCSNCHKLVDDDPGRYPAGLLFEWQRNHEQRVAEAIGKAGAELRERYERRHLEEFGRLSYLAERLIIEKGGYWEFKLTAEVLRFELAPVLRRWDALKRGMYVKPMNHLVRDESIPWFLSRLDEMTHIAQGFTEIMNVEFARSWGDPGVPGDDAMIISTCRLFADMCQSAVDWEECVRFARPNDVFEEIHNLFIGVAGRMIDEAAKVSTFLTEKMSGEVIPGEYALNLTFTLPEDWETNIARATQKAQTALLHSI